MLWAPAAASPLSPQIRAGKDIVIKDVRIIVPSTSVNQYGPSAQWYVIKFTFTNTTPYDFIPQLNKFEFQGDDNIEVSGVTTGSPDLIGVENPHANDVLKTGASYDYTVAFLVGGQSAGYIFYNPT